MPRFLTWWIFPCIFHRSLLLLAHHGHRKRQSTGCCRSSARPESGLHSPCVDQWGKRSLLLTGWPLEWACRSECWKAAGWARQCDCPRYQTNPKWWGGRCCLHQSVCCCAVFQRECKAVSGSLWTGGCCAAEMVRLFSAKEHCTFRGAQDMPLTSPWRHKHCRSTGFWRTPFHKAGGETIETDMALPWTNFLLDSFLGLVSFSHSQSSGNASQMDNRIY